MQIIHHRVNSIEKLKNLSLLNGAEIDIRYHKNELILHHDPFHHHEKNLLRLKDFLENWTYHGPLILNLKSEGIEEKCIKLMKNFNVRSWFFLDMSMPFFVKYSNLTNNKNFRDFNSSNLAVRFSDFEPIEYALSFYGKVSWVWVDTFKDLALSMSKYKMLKKYNFKICLVSPELQGFEKDEIVIMRSKLSNMSIDAVCTKYPELWS